MIDVKKIKELLDLYPGHHLDISISLESIIITLDDQKYKIDLDSSFTPTSLTATAELGSDKAGIMLKIAQSILKAFRDPVSNNGRIVSAKINRYNTD